MAPRRSVSLCFLLLLVTGLISAGGPRQELDEEEVLAGLQAWLDGTTDLQGQFEQTLVSGALGTGLRERGRLTIQRPGRMRWDYLDPEYKVAIVDGDRTWLYVAEERQLFLGRLGEEGDLLPTLLAGTRPLRELFEPSLLATPRLGGNGAYRLRLSPRTTSDAVEQVVLDLRPPRFRIEAAEVLDAAGNRIDYRFGEIKRNRGVDARVFRFRAPGGTTVVGSH